MPTRKDENWKYTSVQEIPKIALQPVLIQNPKVKTDFSKIEPLLSKSFYNLVFINGKLSHELSDFQTLSGKVEIVQLNQLTNKAKEVSPNFLSEFKALRRAVGGVSQDSFEALNSAFSSCGIAIRIKKEASLDRPLHVIYYTDTKENANYFKCFVICEERSQFSLIESYAGIKNGTYLSNTVTEVLLKKSSKVEYIRFQDDSLSAYNYGRTRFYLQAQSHLESTSCSVGAKLGRHNLDIYFVGPEGFAQVNGLYLSSGSQHLDSHTLIDHVVGRCTSRQHYKGILDNSSRAVFDGKVVIRQDAQQASSDQLNNNLLLSSKAEVDSKPQLQIYADDVKATHGSTVGQLNQEEIFYFLSRAISKDKAMEMLSLGYVSEVIFQVSHQATKSWLQEKVFSAYRRWRNS